jgi:hypothetical protein
MLWLRIMRASIEMSMEINWECPTPWKLFTDPTTARIYLINV